MSQTETLFKLMALEPIRHDDLLRVTGWPMEETRAALAQLLAARRVTSHNTNGERWYRPAEPRAATPPPRIAANDPHADLALGLRAPA